MVVDGVVEVLDVSLTYLSTTAQIVVLQVSSELHSWLADVSVNILQR